MSTFVEVVVKIKVALFVFGPLCIFAFVLGDCQVSE